MTKESCTCEPKERGCAHFLGGKCRLMQKNNELGNCIMRKESYHYACCAYLSSEEGLKDLAIYTIERDFAYKITCHCNSQKKTCIAKVGWRCNLTKRECVMKKDAICQDCCPIPRINASENILTDIENIMQIKGGN